MYSEKKETAAVHYIFQNYTSSHFYEITDEASQQAFEDTYGPIQDRYPLTSFRLVRGVYFFAGHECGAFGGCSGSAEGTVWRA
ncbi:hypothetical protein XYCOK13_26330 [Xylanibacillus composti]|uniref:Uncharacterized protein n=1 Tax=Xylanibacillus composti TaxID=1572762 RepID=A0A8J4H2R8_9BACL|nr:hypothetical protein XYCOK13_26330 [Xylanibacillus composti]